MWPRRWGRLRARKLAPRRSAFRQHGRPSCSFSVSSRHGAALHARQPAQQSGPRPHLRKRLEGDKSLNLGRRKFLGLGSAALVGLSLKSEKKIEGSFVNDSFQMAQIWRDRASFPAPKRVERVPVVIVGGGSAGLSASWRLRKRGFSDFVLLEMNSQPGGNARWGENEITAYPWAAHYVPVPGPKAVYVRELFEDLGVLKNGQWEERYLAFSPQERLFLYGRWQEGIEPAVGLKPKDRDQFQRLENLFTDFRKSGSFTVPLELGLSEKLRDLDRISFFDWLRQQGFDSRLLQWYMNYACRDDYGALSNYTSAWPGIHYFSSLDAEEKGPLLSGHHRPGLPYFPLPPPSPRLMRCIRAPALTLTARFGPSIGGSLKVPLRRPANSPLKEIGPPGKKPSCTTSSAFTPTSASAFPALM